MPSTPLYGWFTPAKTAPPAVAQDMQNLAEAVEGTVSGLDGELGPVRSGYIYLTTVYFTGSGTFFKANFPGLKAVRVKLVGGGGSCGGVGATAVSEGAEGGGGAGGEYAERFLLASEVASSEPVVVGTGGTAAAAGANGNDGLASSFGTTLVVGNGGEHGNVMSGGSSNDTTQGGEGGTGGTGDLTIDGSDGGPGRRTGSNIVHANYGGHSFLSASAHTGIANTSGEAGRLYGGGSGGCNSGASQSARGSTPGADGIVIVDVYV